MREEYQERREWEEVRGMRIRGMSMPFPTEPFPTPKPSSAKLPGFFLPLQPCLPAPSSFPLSFHPSVLRLVSVQSTIKRECSVAKCKAKRWDRCEDAGVQAVRRDKQPAQWGQPAVRKWAASERNASRMDKHGMEGERTYTVREHGIQIDRMTWGEAACAREFSQERHGTNATRATEARGMRCFVLR